MLWQSEHRLLVAGLKCLGTLPCKDTPHCCSRAFCYRGEQEGCTVPPSPAQPWAQSQDRQDPRWVSLGCEWGWGDRPAREQQQDEDKKSLGGKHKEKLRKGGL